MGMLGGTIGLITVVLAPGNSIRGALTPARLSLTDTIYATALEVLVLVIRAIIFQPLAIIFIVTIGMLAGSNHTIRRKGYWLSLVFLVAVVLMFAATFPAVWAQLFAGRTTTFTYLTVILGLGLCSFVIASKTS